MLRTTRRKDCCLSLKSNHIFALLFHGTWTLRNCLSCFCSCFCMYTIWYKKEYITKIIKKIGGKKQDKNGFHDTTICLLCYVLHDILRTIYYPPFFFCRSILCLCVSGCDKKRSTNTMSSRPFVPSQVCCCFVLLFTLNVWDNRRSLFFLYVCVCVCVCIWWEKGE